MIRLCPLIFAAIVSAKHTPIQAEALKESILETEPKREFERRNLKCVEVIKYSRADKSVKKDVIGEFSRDTIRLWTQKVSNVSRTLRFDDKSKTWSLKEIPVETRSLKGIPDKQVVVNCVQKYKSKETETAALPQRINDWSCEGEEEDPVDMDFRKCKKTHKMSNNLSRTSEENAKSLETRSTAPPRKMKKIGDMLRSFLPHMYDKNH